MSERRVGYQAGRSSTSFLILCRYQQVSCTLSILLLRVQLHQLAVVRERAARLEGRVIVVEVVCMQRCSGGVSGCSL
eukprot:9107317-Pyramimonas_sp.AAC.1